MDTPRNTIRYKRSDICVLIYQGRDSEHAELVDISQQGMAIRLASSLKKNRLFGFRVTFNDNKAFELKGYVTNKSIVQTEDESQDQKIKWSLFKPKNSVYSYSISFNEACDDFKAYLIQSSMQRRLKNHDKKLNSSRLEP